MWFVGVLIPTAGHHRKVSGAARYVLNKSRYVQRVCLGTVPPSCMILSPQLALLESEFMPGKTHLMLTCMLAVLFFRQPPIHWVPGVLSPGVKRGRGVTLTAHPHLVPRLSMSRRYTSSPPMCLHGV
jgi:hypothetical protein